MKYSSVSLILFFALSWARPGHALPKCFGGLFARLAPRQIEVLSIPSKRVLDQGCFGSCWINAEVGSLETSALAHGEKLPDISVDALVVRHLQAQVDDVLDRPGREFDDGGGAHLARRLIMTVGVVPEGSFRLRTPITTDRRIKQKLFADLEARRERFMEDRAKLISEREISADEKRLRQQRYDKLHEEARSDLLQIIEDAAGTVPEEFEVAGKQTTAAALGRRFLDPDKGATELVPRAEIPIARPVERHPAPPPPLPPAFVPRSPPPVAKLAMNLRTRDAALPEIKRTLIEAFRAKRRMTMAIDWLTGSVSGGRLATAGWPMRWLNGLFFSGGGGGHELQIVGLTIAKVGGIESITEIEVQNSWGVGAGNGGRYKISAEYFDKHLISVTIDD